MWHASIARLGPVTPIPTARWGEGVNREAKRQLFNALKDVGKEPTVISMGKIAIHMRRSLSDEEMATLSCEWLAIPALNEFSEGTEMEMAL